MKYIELGKVCQECINDTDVNDDVMGPDVMVPNAKGP
jgi:hypothetical protein